MKKNVGRHPLKLINRPARSIESATIGASKKKQLLISSI